MLDCVTYDLVNNNSNNNNMQISIPPQGRNFRGSGSTGHINDCLIL